MKIDRPPAMHHDRLGTGVLRQPGPARPPDRSNHNTQNTCVMKVVRVLFLCLCMGMERDYMRMGIALYMYMDQQWGPATINLLDLGPASPAAPPDHSNLINAK